MHLNPLLRSLLVTHAPYWVAAVYMVVSARRARRAIERVARSLRDAERPGP